MVLFRNLFWTILVGVNLIGLTRAGAVDTVTWYISDFPPWYILEGDLKGQGVSDLWMQRLTQDLPEYHHKAVVANTKRKIKDLTEKDYRCTNSLLKNPARAEKIYFSEPFMMVHGNGFIMRDKLISNVQHFFDEEGAINLEQLLAARQFKIGVTLGRSYGTYIDDIIRRNDNSSILQHAKGAGITTLLQMISVGRLDAIIGFPAELAYQTAGQEDDFPVDWYPVQGANKYIESYIACSKTPWGLRMIERINDIVRRIRVEPDVIGYNTKWLPASVRPQYIKDVKARFSER